MKHGNSMNEAFHSITMYAVLLLLLVVISAFTHLDPGEFTLVGRWRTDREGTIEQMSSAKRSAYESRPEPMKDMLRNSLDNRFYEFKKDGTVVFTFVKGESTRAYAGTWKYDANSGRLQTISHDGIETSFTVSIVSPDQIILVKEMDDQSMLDNLVLQRIKE